MLAQALHAAYRTVPADRFVHSMHGYFILAGDIHEPIVYDVDRIRDGGSFTTRRVVAIQKGRAIFNLSASFQLEQEGLKHQITMPNVPPPDALASDEQPSNTPSSRYARPIEFRTVEKNHPDNSRNASPFRHIWLKAKGELPDEKRLHQEVFAYASDYHLLGTAFLPHQDQSSAHSFFFASLDHALWFHRDFRVDEWLLYAMDSPSASNARGFTRGNIFTEDGTLVASAAQEGLIRERR